MSSNNDPRLMWALLADEAARAEGTGASEARAHRDEDEQAAIFRADAATAGRPNVLRRILNRLRHPVR